MKPPSAPPLARRRALARVARAGVFPGLRMVQRLHLAPDRCRVVLLRLGTPHPVRAGDDRSVPVHRPVLRRVVFPVPHARRTARPRLADRAGHRHVGGGISVVSRCATAGRARRSPDGWGTCSRRSMRSTNRTTSARRCTSACARCCGAFTGGTRARSRSCAGLCAGWFLLIGVSTLLVYQHHVIDLLGGYLVALFCRAVVRENDASRTVAGPQNGETPCPPPPLPRSAPPSWRRWSKSSPAAACAGSVANPAPGSACISPTTPATSTPLVLWAALPPEARALTRPVAARDYWTADPVRRHLATRVFNAVLIDRQRRQRARAQSHRTAARGARKRPPPFADPLSRRHARQRAGRRSLQERPLPSRPASARR